MMTEDALVQRAVEDFGELETYEKIGQPGRFLAALEAYNLNGMSDEENGTVEAPTGHFYRVERWIVITDSQGFHHIEAYDTNSEAEVAFENLEREYSMWDEV